MLAAIWKKKKKGSNFVGKSTIEQDHNHEASTFFFEDHQDYCYSFLRFCHLCHKPLTLDKEVYMYRGNLGFCSVECRCRQIYLDEMKKIEVSTRRILASFHRRRRNGGGRCEIGDVRGVHPTAAPPFFISM